MKIKKIFIILIILFLCINTTHGSNFVRIKVNINGRCVNLHQGSVFLRGTLYLPLKEMLGELFFSKDEIKAYYRKIVNSKFTYRVNGIAMVPYYVFNGFKQVKCTLNKHTVNYIVNRFLIKFIPYISGECIYLRYNDFNMLINAGTNQDEHNIEKEVKSDIVGKIDILIITNAQENYIGGAPYIIKQFGIKKVVFPGKYENTSEFQAFLVSMLKKRHEGDSSKLINSSYDTFIKPKLLVKTLKVDNKLAVLINLNKNKIVLLNDTNKFEQYKLLSKYGNILNDASIIQINDLSDFMMYPRRMKKPRDIVTYCKTIADNPIIKVGNGINVIKFNKNDDICLNYDNFYNHLERVYLAGNRIPKWVEYLLVCIFFVSLGIILIGLYRCNKNEIKDNEKEKYKLNDNISYLGDNTIKFMDCLRFKKNVRFESIEIYIVLFVGFAMTMQFVLGREFDSNRYINIVWKIGMVLVMLGLLIGAIKFLFYLISLFNSLTSNLRKNKEINKKSRVEMTILIPILVDLFCFMTFSFRINIVLKYIELLMSIIVLVFNYTWMIRGIVLTMYYGQIFSELKGNKKLIAKIKVIIAWFIIICVNSFVLLSIVTYYPNNYFYDNSTMGKANILGILYFVVISVFTVGYGDIYPVGVFARIADSFVILVGVFYTILSVGQILGLEYGFKNKYKLSEKKKKLYRRNRSSLKNISMNLEDIRTKILSELDYNMYKGKYDFIDLNKQLISELKASNYCDWKKSFDEFYEKLLEYIGDIEKRSLFIMDVCTDTNNDICFSDDSKMHNDEGTERELKISSYTNEYIEELSYISKISMILSINISILSRNISSSKNEYYEIGSQIKELSKNVELMCKKFSIIVNELEEIVSNKENIIHMKDREIERLNKFYERMFMEVSEYVLYIQNVKKYVESIDIK